MRTRVAKLSVTAPVSGLILERTVRPGDLSAVAATPWFRIARDSEVELAAQVSEDDLGSIHDGQHAMVTLPGGEVVAGVVRLVSPQIDNQSKLGLVRVHLPGAPLTSGSAALRARCSTRRQAPFWPRLRPPSVMTPMAPA